MFPKKKTKKKQKRLWLGKDWKLSGPPILSLRFYTAASGQTVVPAIEGELLCWYKMLGGSGSLQDFDLVITLFFFVEIILSSTLFLFWKFFNRAFTFFLPGHYNLHILPVSGCVDPLIAC